MAVRPAAEAAAEAAPPGKDFKKLDPNWSSFSYLDVAAKRCYDISYGNS